MNRIWGLRAYYNTIIFIKVTKLVWTDSSARRGLVDFVDERSGMKWNANGDCGGVDLAATAALKSGRGNCGERVWVREEEGVHKCGIHLCCFLLLASAA